MQQKNTWSKTEKCLPLAAPSRKLLLNSENKKPCIWPTLRHEHDVQQASENTCSQEMKQNQNTCRLSEINKKVITSIVKFTTSILVLALFDYSCVMNEIFGRFSRSTTKPGVYYDRHTVIRWLQLAPVPADALSCFSSGGGQNRGSRSLEIGWIRWDFFNWFNRLCRSCRRWLHQIER